MGFTTLLEQFEKTIDAAESVSDDAVNLIDDALQFAEAHELDKYEFRADSDGTPREMVQSLALAFDDACVALLPAQCADEARTMAHGIELAEQLVVKAVENLPSVEQALGTLVASLFKAQAEATERHDLANIDHAIELLSNDVADLLGEIGLL